MHQGRQKIIHLKEEIKHLKTESVELKNLKLSLDQDLLEKERSLRLVAENHQQNLQCQLINMNAEIEELAMENAMLKTQLEQLHQPPNVNYLQTAYNAVNEEYHRVATENIALNKKLSQQHVDSHSETTYII